MNREIPKPDFKSEYPTGRVAEHECFLAFNSDSDAEAFEDWWNERGYAAFAEWAAAHAEDYDR